MKNIASDIHATGILPLKFNEHDMAIYKSIAEGTRNKLGSIVDNGKSTRIRSQILDEIK